MQKNQIAEWRVGRNFIRLGDTVKVTSSPGKRDTYLARVTKIIEVGGDVAEVEVVGAKGFRTYLPDRIQRVAQTKHGQKAARPR